MKHFDLVGESATYNDGTGTYTLTGALPGRRAFSGTVDSGTEVCYRAWDESRTRWEVGYGTYNGAAVVRTTWLGGSTGVPSAPAYVGQIDIEIVAAAATMPVAHGTVAPVAGSNAVAVGSQASAPEESSIAIGAYATIYGPYGVAVGSGAVVDHDGAVSLGLSTISFAPQTEQFGRAWRWSGRASTESATPQDVRDYQFESIPLTVGTGKVVAFRALICGRRESDNAAYAAEVVGAAVRNGTTPTLLGSQTVTEIGKTAGVTVSCALVARAGGVIAVEVAGEAGELWDWSVAMTGVRV